MNAGGFLVLGILVIFFFMAGCMEMRSKEDCTGADATNSCYADAAFGYAVRGDRGEAVSMCNRMEETGALVGSSDRDLCLMRVAEVLKDPSVCDGISFDASGELSSPITKNLCKRKAEPAAKPCGMAFVLAGSAVLLVFAYISKSRTSPLRGA